MEQEFTHEPKPPLYTQEGTVERKLLDDAEQFFVERDENLRYGLVKRMVQWMLDTDENGWFEPMYNPLMRVGGGRNPVIRPSHLEIDQYIGTIANDISYGRLTDELSVLNEYLMSIIDEIPKEYFDRHQRVMHYTREHNDMAARRLAYRHEDFGIWRDRITRRRYDELKFDENSPL